ncbi:MAG TPA: hypothetical protein VMT74_07020 [Gaiellaceae bacterium]|nr:hypothetical protein [Gaiellaceae bacterium]
MFADEIAAVRRVVRIVAAVTAFLLYVWVEAVRLAPAVKRRKAMRRRGIDARR